MNDIVMPLPSTTDSTESVAQDRAIRFRSLVDSNFAFIWRSLRGLGVPADAADDAAQQVFLIASQKLESVALGSERAFLFGTARGVAANVRRARARNREVLDETAMHTQPDDAPDGEQLVEMKERRALLNRVLADMPDDLRTVFVLFVLEGLEAPQIGELLDIPTGTVASRLRRARELFHTLSKRLQARAAPRGGVP